MGKMIDVWCVVLSSKGHLKKKEQSDNVDGFFSQDDDEVEPEEEPSKWNGRHDSGQVNLHLTYL